MRPRDQAKLSSRVDGCGADGYAMLDVRTLGATQVQFDGVAAAFHSKTAEELFFYLLSHPEGKFKEEIFETLWGETPSKEANNRFRVNLHRVRSALNDPQAITESHGRYRLNPAILEHTDMHRLFKALELAGTSTDTSERLTAFQRVLGIYKGDFLPGVNAGWASQAREELKSVYVRANLELSVLHCDMGACEGAVGALVRALRADLYIGENYHQQLMTCLSVVESKYAAIEHYRRFLNFLREQLSDTAMPETIALAERIKSGERICDNSHKHIGAGLSLNCPFTPDGSCPGEGLGTLRAFRNPDVQPEG